MKKIFWITSLLLISSMSISYGLSSVTLENHDFTSTKVENNSIFVFEEVQISEDNEEKNDNLDEELCCRTASQTFIDGNTTITLTASYCSPRGCQTALVGATSIVLKAAEKADLL